ncbi:MAG: hypothetical protein JW922_02065, partial [Paludibacteraceae bacterium]|nr:hypothetical protein [Paludibacteraceae bacterium]
MVLALKIYSLSLTQLFSPKREEKKRRKKRKRKLNYRAVLKGLSRFFGKILPEVKRKCGDFGKNPKGLTFTDLVAVSALSLLFFLFLEKY